MAHAVSILLRGFFGDLFGECKGHLPTYTDIKSTPTSESTKSDNWDPPNAIHIMGASGILKL